MKMQTTAGQLHAGLAALRGIVGRRNTIPVLSMVRLADGKVTGTNLDTEVSVSLPSIGGMEGAAAIDYFALSALVRRVDADETLAISDVGNLSTVAFSGSEYRMSSLSASDFPDFAMPKGTTTATGNLGLVDAMRRVRFAVSSEETRYYLNGVALLLDGDGKPVLAATDGHRLAYQPLDAMPEGAAGVIVPRELVHYLCSRKGEPDAVTFDAERHRARFDYAGLTVAAKLIDGTFPDIFRAIPKDPKPVFSVERLRLLRVLHRMRAFNQSGLGRGVKLTGAGTDLTLTLGSSEQQATEKVGMVGDAAKPFEAGYNIDYLISAMAALRAEVVTFAADGELVTGPALNPLASTPCVITCADDSLRIVQMPMRV